MKTLNWFKNQINEISSSIINKSKMKEEDNKENIEEEKKDLKEKEENIIKFKK